MDYVYVLDVNGKPLMPTKRFGKVRRMLKSGKAVAVTTVPFTIRLTYEPETKITQDVILGIDPGRTNIGLAGVKNSGRCLYASECETRNKEIPKLMRKRKQYRQVSRRGERLARKRLAKKLGTTMKHLMERMLPGCEKPVQVKDIINTEACFNNRKRTEGWLTPTAAQLLRTHLNLVKKVCRILPISSVAVELNKFAFMALDDPTIQKWQYQKGPMYGFSSTREALEYLQEGKCLLCGTNPIEEEHHIVPRCKGGSDTLANRAGVCHKCHVLVQNDNKAAAKLSEKKKGLNKKYGALSVLNQIMPYLLKGLVLLFPGSVFVTRGWDTKRFRESNGLDKQHYIDAYCIACSVLEVTNRSTIGHVYKIFQFRRHDRAIIKRQTERTYKLGKETVAKNRRKRMDQKTDSLKEWFDAMKEEHGVKEAETMRSQLKAVKSYRTYNNPERYLPGMIFLYKGKRYILSGNHGPYYRALGFGAKEFNKKECKVLAGNTGIVYAAQSRSGTSSRV